MVRRLEGAWELGEERFRTGVLGCGAQGPRSQQAGAGVRCPRHLCTWSGPHPTRQGPLLTSSCDGTQPTCRAEGLTLGQPGS